jgi:hypothetical protein
MKMGKIAETKKASLKTGFFKDKAKTSFYGAGGFLP